MNQRGRMISLFFARFRHYYRIECKASDDARAARRAAFKKWVNDNIYAKYPYDETSSMGRGQ
jgi:hypothetical protein